MDLQKTDTWVHEGDFIITSDMLIDGKMIKEKIPDEITGNFDCSYSGLTTLEGCSTTVGKSFYCENNLLSSLEGGPKIVNGSFFCYTNKLTSLEGCPTTVSGDFNCNNNKLTSLEECPITVGGNIYCSYNLQDLTIEHDFIKSGRCSSQSNYGKANAKAYWQELLKYMIDEKIELNKITTWPKGFLNPEIIDSVKGIKKFML